MKVMLIFPPFSQPEDSKKRCLVPLGITYVAGYLRKYGVDVKIVDCVVEGYYNNKIKNGVRTFGLDNNDIQKYIYNYKPDFVGVSCMMTAQLENALSVCKIVKQVNKDIHTFMGGAHPSVFPNETLANKEVDSVIIGEGELSTLDIVKHKLKGIVKRDILDIDSIPWPARDLLPMEKYISINMPENIFSPNDRVTQMITSRGCPFKCTFCATTNIHGAWRGRNTKDIIEEIKYLKDTYNINEINFIDENLVLNRERTIEIMNNLKELNIAWSNPGGIWVNGLDNELLDMMKEAGCYQLTFPVESCNEDTLKNVINKPLDITKVKPLVKHCHKLGIDIHAFYILGFPEQTKNDMKNDFKCAKYMGFDSASFHIITPIPGSRLYEKYKDYVDINKINYIKSTIPHPTLTAKEIETLAKRFNIEFNKSFKWRHPIKYFKKYVLLPYRKKFSNPLQRV